MEDCRTPTFTTPREFKFNVTPTAKNSTVHSYHDIHNIMANRRSFTPVHNNYRSPGLSPIYPVDTLTHHSSSFMQFKKPTLLAKPVVTYTASPKYGDKTNFLSPCPAFGSNFSTSPSYGTSDNSSKSPQSEDSKNISILDHTLSIKILLKTLGLERYCENFEKAGIDCKYLMDIKSCDLINIGITSREDRNCIMEMFQNIFSTST
ncbi:protein matrimony [Lucilia sericata]|uniref:protein matrimony n=1 Tax=Lucilia sericata TaxID=13632 RepID=UPI0018A85EC4|nr:protein matrimony [Lucilia sericata]